MTSILYISFRIKDLDYALHQVSILEILASFLHTTILVKGSDSAGLAGQDLPSFRPPFPILGKIPKQPALTFSFTKSCAAGQVLLGKPNPTAANSLLVFFIISSQFSPRQNFILLLYDFCNFLGIF
ncbi:MAG: hypothetical protein ACLFVG_08775 [Candidatus Aminicenantes bacterium]